MLGYAEILNFFGDNDGPHGLRREGAKLVETVVDIFEEFGDTLRRFGEKTIPAATSVQREPLLEYIDYGPTPVDHIAKPS